MKRPLSITLSPDLERFVNEKIEKGYYPSATHLVSGALEALRTQEQLTKGDVAELRQDIKLGLQQLDRGESAPWSAKAIKNRLRREIKRKE